MEGVLLCILTIGVWLLGFVAVDHVGRFSDRNREEQKSAPRGKQTRKK